MLRKDTNTMCSNAWRKMKYLSPTCRSVLGVRAAKPQSDRWGLSSSSSNIFADLKFLCTTEGKQTSCKYLINKAYDSRNKTECNKLSSRYNAKTRNSGEKARGWDNMSRPLWGETCACFESRRKSKHALNMLLDGYATYSKARAVPRAMRTRAFQGKPLLLSSAKWSMSCRFPFPIYS